MRDEDIFDCIVVVDVVGWVVYNVDVVVLCLRVGKVLVCLNGWCGYLCWCF